jgi:hypothetical protein
MATVMAGAMVGPWLTNIAARKPLDLALAQHVHGFMWVGVNGGLSLASGDWQFLRRASVGCRC